MSEQKGRETTSPAKPVADSPSAASLTDLMAGGAKKRAKAAPAEAVPDLEGEALRAAEQALADGEHALATANEQLARGRRPGLTRGRELALRVLLTVNVLAMVVVASLPSPRTNTSADPATSAAPPAPVAPPAPEKPGTKFNEPWNQALAAAERGEFAAAVKILEQYLADSPRMAPSQKLSVLSTLSHYAARNDDFKKAQEYERRADAIEQSHSLPEDLVAMAKAAAESGDQESLRRVWARFLLQQRQVPTWLYKHVAEAYLQLGDSYRNQANAAAELARLREAEETAARVRAEALDGKEKGK